MVIDTSAILAILLQEPDADRYARAIEADPERLLSSASLLEAGIVLLGREGPEALQDLADFVVEGGITVEPVTADLAWRALHAYERFGKGRHRAALNFGDCFAYALARSARQPLLFKGRDFAATDVGAVPLG